MQLGDQQVTAHCPNPGSMLGMKDPDLKVWLEPNDDPKRKLNFSWKLAEIDGGLVVIDTALANKVVQEGFTSAVIPALAAYTNIRPEVRYGENSRIDFLLTADDLPDCYVEVKSVTLSRQQGLAEFPDSVTKRGTKHLQELSDMVSQGHRAVMLYLVQRSDCQRFELAGDIDPAYAAAYEVARQKGVETLVFTTDITTEGITIANQIASGPSTV